MKRKLPEVIYDLVHLLSKNRLQINYPWKDSSNYQHYFDLIIAGNPDVTIIAKKLGYKNEKDKSFTRLQQRFENKLSFLIFAIDLEFENRVEFGKQLHNIILHYSQGKLLLQRGLRPTAMFYFNKAMIIAKKSSLTEYEYLLNYEFYKYYSTIDFNNLKKIHFHNELNNSQYLMNAELEVKGYESELVELVSKNVDKKLLVKSAKHYSDVCTKLVSNHFSYFLNLTVFQINVFYYNLVNEYDKIFNECNYLKDKLAANKIFSEGSSYAIETAFLNALISSYRFKEAMDYILKNTKVYKTGTHSYFSRMNQYFKVLMRLREYNVAINLTVEIFSHKSLKLFARFNELWLIKKGYLHLLVELGKIEETQNEEYKKMSKYKLSKLLNQIDIYSKDKTGQNAGLRILEMCFFIVRQEEDQLIDKIESIKQYAYRYLRKDEDLRFRLFFRFLITCYEQNYNAQAIRRHTEDLFLKLVDNPQELKDSIIEAEIIPFEDLWDYMIEFIEENYSQRV